MKLGYYVGGFNEEWRWLLNKDTPYSEEELWHLYLELKYNKI